MSATTLPAPKKPIDTVRDLLLRSKDQIAMAVPKHLTPDRVIRVALTCVQRTPALLECSPLSIVGCVMQATELGLELAGPLGQAYMVPYYNKNTRQKEAQFQIGYRGLVDLTYRSSLVALVEGVVVYANDHFRHRRGTKPLIEHIPTMDDPGEWVAVYAVLRMANGAVGFEVMGREAVKKHRDRYSKSWQRDDSAWKTAEEEMAKKTVLRRLLKIAPVSIEVRTAALRDEYAEAGVTLDADGFLPPAASRSDLLAHALEENQAATAPTDEDYTRQVPREPGAEG